MKKVILFFALATSRLIFSQDINGRLTGQVIDSLGIPVPYINVIISGNSLQGIRGTSSDDQGYFFIQNLPTGLFDVNIRSVNYQTITYKEIRVQLGATTSLGVIILKSKAVNLPEVVIYDKKSLIDPTSTTAGGRLEYKTFDALPTDRNFRNMLSLIPQVSTSYFKGDEANVAGSTGPENIYYIDGANVTSLINSSTSTNLPYNFVKEVQIKSGGYEAEFGHALGGIVNVITQSGSNEFHGQFFSFFTNNVFGGEGRPGLEVVKVPSFESYDLGFSFGGPIIHDRLWYFAAYNPNVNVVDVQLPGFGDYSDKKTSHLFAGKLNWQPDQNTGLMFSTFGDPSTRQAISTGKVENGWTILNKDPLFYQINEGGYNFSINGWHIFNDNLLFESSASFFRYINEIYPGGKFEPYFTDYISNTISGGIGEKDKSTGTRSSIKASITLLLPGHSIKTGIQFEDNSYKTDILVNPSGSFIDKYSDSSYSAYYFYSDGGTVRNRVLSAFLQDSWKVSERFTLNAGFRWDAQFLISSDGNLWQSIRDEYQPRIGLIYQPGQIGTQKIFASYGRFYEQIPLILAAVYGARSPWVEIDYDHNPLLDPSGGKMQNYFGSILPNISNLKGEYFDEFLLGYEVEVLKYLKLTFKGTYRYLPQVIEDGVDPNTGDFIVGNPGTSNMSFFPRLYRIYKSFEITLQKLQSDNFDFSISYILSRNYGNYAGLYEDRAPQPNTSGLPDFISQIPNDEGLLPNDRTHVFKLSGYYSFSFGLGTGMSLVWETGTPLTEFAGSPTYFLSPRGTAGRTPSIWDLSFRFTYSLDNIIKTSFKPKVMLDLFHIFSQRTPVEYDQTHYFSSLLIPNQNYLTPITYQPPFTARLGLEVEF
jgi:hypothetical protein